MTKEPDFLKEFDEYLENIDKVPPPKPRVEHLKDKLAAPPDVVRANEALAQTQARHHEQERRQLAPNATLLRNFKLYGRARGPLPPDEQRRQNLQFALDAAIERQRLEQEHERWLRAQANEFNMGLY